MEGGAAFGFKTKGGPEASFEQVLGKLDEFLAKKKKGCGGGGGQRTVMRGGGGRLFRQSLPRNSSEKGKDYLRVIPPCGAKGGRRGGGCPRRGRGREGGFHWSDSDSHDPLQSPL